MDEDLRELVDRIEVRPPTDLERLRVIAKARGVALPDDYLDFMAFSDGGQGEVGEGWIELWPVARILGVAESDPALYEDFLAFAGDGANTVYGFDAAQEGTISEGDFIGLARDELIPRGRTFVEFLRSIAQG